MPKADKRGADSRSTGSHVRIRIIVVALAAVVAALPAVLAVLAGELERDGYPLVPVAVLLLLHVHSYGLWFLGQYLTQLAGGLPDMVYPLLQPALWGVLLLFELTVYRVGLAVEVPSPISIAVRKRLDE